jgi:hypothetical protein
MGCFNFKKLKNWEYWPSYMFYIPNLPYAFYLAIRAKNLVFFSTTNPAIKHSGNGSESKYSTLQLIPEIYKPLSIFIKKNENLNTVLKLINEKSINFPLIIKPDIGFRGLLVKKINTKNELLEYLSHNNYIDLIIQEFIDYKNECGIFYHRIPGQLKGEISSITLKKFLSVTGDGVSSLKELIFADDRAINYVDILIELHQKEFPIIIPKGKIKILSNIGNHSKGTQFINGNHLITPELETAIDTIFQKIPNWYYGRLDIKYNSFEALKQLKEFKIIEINGIISEPTHIYDPFKSTYLQALKEIRKHWKLIYKIAVLNHSENHIKYDSINEFIRSIISLKKYSKQIKLKELSN